MFASTSRLEVPFRSDGDFLNRVLAAADFDRTLETPPFDAGIVELITEALFRALQESFQRDPCCHAGNLWAAAGNFADAVIRLHAPSSQRWRQSVDVLACMKWPRSRRLR